MRETQVQSLGQEDPLEKEMATHSSTLAWKIPWTEEPVGYSPWGPKELDTTEWLHFLLSSVYWEAWSQMPLPGGTCILKPDSLSQGSISIPKVVLMHTRSS